MDYKIIRRNVQIVVLIGAFPAAVLIALNPDLRAPKKHRHAAAEPFSFALSTQAASGSQGKPKEITDSQYRGGPQRTGESLLKNQDHWRGQSEWSYRPFNIGVHSASKASPAVDSTGIYTGTDAGKFFALNFAGNPLWQFVVADADFGIHSTAALDQSSVYFGAYNGRFYALDKLSGQVRWILPLGDAIGSSPLILGPHIYVTVETSHPADGYLVKVDKISGTVIWRTPHLGEQIHSSPATDTKGEFIYIGVNNGDLLSISTETGHVQWKTRTGGPVKSTPAVIGDQVFFTSWDYYLYALDRRTGRLNWRVNLGSASQSSPTYVPSLDLIIAAGNLGRLVAVNTKSGELRWQKELNALTLASPALIKSGKQNQVAFTCGTQILCILDAANGSQVWQTRAEGILTSVPVAYGDSIYFALDFPGGLMRVD